jgi:molybdopterin molybdotransferase
MRERRLVDDCFVTDRERMRHDEALAILRARITPVAPTVTVPLAEAHGRILAADLRSPRNVPAHDNAAVDGYAFAHADYAAAGGRLRVAGRAAAGHPLPASPEPGTAVRIFTGAVMPAGTDSVAMDEDCELVAETGGTIVVVPPGLRRGANRRKAGEDLAEGAVAAARGARLRPQEIAALASIGRSEIAVHAPLRVALLSTGDEIARPGRPLEPGAVYDSNHFLVRALLETLGCEVTDAGIAPDDAGTVRTALARLAEDHDAILTTGGASRGEEDHLAQSLAALGKRHIWQLAVKPGRPMSFGQIADCAVVALPGNPVAVFVCFLLYVRPMLTLMGGGLWPEPQRVQVVADFDMPKSKPDRREFLRGRLTADAAGRAVVTKFPRDGSGLITSLRESDGLIEIAEEVTEVRRGALVTFLPYTGMGLLP